MKQKCLALAAIMNGLCCVAALAVPTAASADTMEVKASYPATSTYFAGKLVYPDNVFAMSMPTGWFAGGSCNGHSLSTKNVDLPEKPGHKGTLLQMCLDKQNNAAPAWVFYSVPLNPELTITGATKAVLEVYPLTPIDFPIYVYSGSQEGFGILPCTWDSITAKPLNVKQWNTVEIPVYQTRKSIDIIRFNVNVQEAGVPHLKEVGVIIGSYRLEPAPKQTLAVSSSKLTSAALNGFWYNQSKLNELSDADSLNLQLEIKPSKPIENATLRVSAGKAVWESPVKITPPFSTFDIQIKAIAAKCGAGQHNLSLELRDAGGGQIASSSSPFPIHIYPLSAMTSRLGALQARLQAIRPKHAALQKHGARVELPAISMNVAGLFIETFIPDDFNRQKAYSIAMKELDEVSAILDYLEKELSAYQNGRLKEKSFTRYNPTLPLEIAGGYFVQQKKPVLLIGPLAWGWGATEAEFICPPQTLGFNSFGMEIGLNDWFGQDKEPTKTGRDYLQKLLDYTQRNGLGFNLLLSSHYLTNPPEPFMKARSGGGGDGNFPWNPLAPESKQLFEIIYGNLTPELAKQIHVISLGTANEPNFGFDPNDVLVKKAFIQWATQKYSTIASANRVWGTSFSSFDTLEGAILAQSQATKPGVAVDIALFTSQISADFYQFLRDDLNRRLPGKPVWVKIMGGMGFDALDEAENLRRGQNVAGSDGASDLWIDNLVSLVPDKPVLNEEWHFVNPDAKAGYHENQMFLSVQRGLQVGNIWYGGRADWSNKGNGMEQSMSRSPLLLNAIGRTSLKLRMNYDVIAQFKKSDGGHIRLIFDKFENLIGKEPYGKSLDMAYSHLRPNAQGVRLTYPNEWNDQSLKNVTLLVAGSLQYTDPKVARSLEQWIMAGGTLWVLTPGELKDYQGKILAANLPLSKALRQNGTTQTGKGTVVVGAKYSGLPAHLSTPYATTDARVNEKVECRSIRNRDGTVKYLSIVNISDESQVVELKGDSKLPRSMVDLWGAPETKTLAGKISLKPYEVILLQNSR